MSDFDFIYKAIIAVIFGAITLGQNASFMPNYADAITAANRLFKLFNRVSLINPFLNDGIQPKTCLGHISFSNAEFAYPSRPNIKVLSGMNMNINPGKNIAIVGIL